MTAINHSLTGVLIGLTVADPLLAMPLAFASHFALDSLPHFGFGGDGNSKLKSKLFIGVLIADTILCLLLVALIVISRPTHWPLAIICGFLAASPDLLSFNRFYSTLKRLPWKPNLYSRFAHKIQWFERPIGAVVEVVWFISLVFCLSFFIRH
jgi:hypothetical protein